jgi:hypothetical protein
MKFGPKFLVFYTAILLVSIVVTATLVTSTADYTLKYGFVVHDRYVLPALISTLTTVLLLYYKKIVEKKVDYEET